MNAYDTYFVPGVADFPFPGGNLPSHLEVFSPHLGIASEQLVVEPLLIVGQHTVRGEVRGNVGNADLYGVEPFVWNVVCATIVVFRNNLVLNRVVDQLGIQFVLEVLILKGAFHREFPSAAFVVTFNPPAIEYAEVHRTIHNSLFAAGARCFERTGRRVQPNIDTLYHATGQLHVVILQENDTPYETRHGSHLDDPLDQILSRFVVRVCLAGKNELYRPFRIIDDRIQTIQVSEEQVSSFVSRETAGETDGQNIRFQHLLNADQLCWRVETELSGIAYPFFDLVDQLFLQNQTLCPQLFVRNLMCLLPCRNIIGWQ